MPLSDVHHVGCPNPKRCDGSCIGSGTNLDRDRYRPYREFKPCDHCKGSGEMAVCLPCAECGGSGQVQK